jgi:hypothetical protein
MDGDLKYVHVAWIPAIPAGMTGLNKLMYNDKSSAWELENEKTAYK